MVAQVDSEQFQMLSLMIEDTTSGMCIYQAATAKEQQLVAKQLKQSSRKSTLVIDMADYAEKTEEIPVDIQQFKKILDQNPGVQVVIVCNLQLCGLWLGDIAYVEKLNYMRDQMMECKKMWVFGMTPYFSILLSQQARDLSTYVMLNCSFVGEENKSVFLNNKMMEYTGNLKLSLSQFEEYHRYVVEQMETGEPDIDMVCGVLQAWLGCSEYLDYTVTEWIRKLTERYRDDILAVESDRGKLFGYELLSQIYMKLDEYQEALGLLEKRLSLVKEVFQPDSEEEAEAYDYMARSCIEIADFERADEYSQKAMEVYRKLGKEHSLDTVYLWSYIAELNNERGNYDRAIEIYQCNIQTVLEFSNESDYRLLMSYSNLGLVYQKKGQLSEALECLDRVRKFVRTYHNGSTAEEVSLLINTASIYRDMGDFMRAKKSLLEAKRDCLRSLGNMNRIMAHIYNNLATVYCDLEQWIPAEKNYIRSIEIELKLYGKIRTHLMLLYSSLVFVYVKQGTQDKLGKAYRLMKEALEICGQLYPPVNEEVIEAYANRALLCAQAHNYGQALTYMEMARDIYKELYGRNSQPVRRMDHNIKTMKNLRSIQQSEK